MKINKITVQNIHGVRHYVMEPREPVTLIAGPNGSGKSTVFEAVRMAFFGAVDRAVLKRDFDGVVTAGEKKGMAAVESDRGRHVFALPAGKATGDAVPAGVLNFLCDHSAFAEAQPDERRRALFVALGVSHTAAEVGRRLTEEMGCRKDLVEAVLPLTARGLEAAHAHAKTAVSEARGAWKAVTGEAYGSSKAEDWEPPAVELPENAEAVAAAAEKECVAINASIQEINQKIGEARAINDQIRQRQEEREATRRDAMLVGRYKQALQTAEENLSAARAALNKAGGIDLSVPNAKLLRGLASVTAGLIEEFQGVGVDEFSEHCEVLVSRGTACLSEYRSLYGEPDAAAADIGSADAARKAVATCERAVENARRDLARCEQAAERMKAEQDGGEKPADIEALQRQLQEAQHNYSNTAREAGALRNSIRAQADRASKIELAAREHFDALEWQKVADALAPDGLPAKIVADATQPFNREAAGIARELRWPTPRVEADMSVTADGRPYRTFSKSEKWRINFVLTAALASASGEKFMMADELDILQIQDRGTLMGWLSERAASGMLDQVFVAGTLKSLPAQLPAHCFGDWLGGAE